MILTPGVPGVAFGTISDGDGRVDESARSAISSELGIPSAWALIDQVHGDTVVTVDSPGHKGPADGLITSSDGVPLAVATADCVPVAIVGSSSVGIFHAGWRGVASRIVEKGIDLMRSNGDDPVTAVVGPHIGSCCYEVGAEVVEAIGGFEATTRWGSRSVDLAAALAPQVAGLGVAYIPGCTMERVEFASHRENATKRRQVAVVWKN